MLALLADADEEFPLALAPAATVPAWPLCAWTDGLPDDGNTPSRVAPPLLL